MSLEEGFFPPGSACCGALGEARTAEHQQETSVVSGCLVMLVPCKVVRRLQCMYPDWLCYSMELLASSHSRLLPDGAVAFHGLDDGSHILDLGSGHCLAAIRFLEILFVAAAGRPFHSFL